MSFGQGMTDEKLLGGIDLKKFQEEGSLEYLLKNAFINHEYVIFEEIWDAPVSILLILKDILQSKAVRMGKQFEPIKTKCIVGCTNRSREEVVSDASSLALMERFVFEVNIGWTSHRKDDYREALKRSAPFLDSPLQETLSELFAELNKVNEEQDYTISPRTAYKAAKVANKCGLKALTNFYGFYEDMVKDAADYYELLKVLEEVESDLAKHSSTSGFIDEVLNNQQILASSIGILSNLGRIPDPASVKFRSLRERVISAYLDNIAVCETLFKTDSSFSSKSKSVKELLKLYKKVQRVLNSINRNKGDYQKLLENVVVPSLPIIHELLKESENGKSTNRQ